MMIMTMIIVEDYLFGYIKIRNWLTKIKDLDRFDKFLLPLYWIFFLDNNFFSLGWVQFLYERFLIMVFVSTVTSPSSSGIFDSSISRIFLHSIALLQIWDWNLYLFHALKKGSFHALFSSRSVRLRGSSWGL